MGILELILAAAISVFLWGEEKKTPDTKPEDGTQALYTEKRREIVQSGGPNVLLINGKELELINRGIKLPDRSQFGDDAAGYSAELDVMLAQTAPYAPLYIPRGPNKFEYASQGDARTVGEQLLNMSRWMYAREPALPPPEVSHFDL